MPLNLRFCEDFKGSDALLLFGSTDSVRTLAQRLRDFSVSSEAVLPIHEFAVSHPEQSIALFAVRAPGTLKHNAVLCFEWPIGWVASREIIAKLEALAEVESGHQYFELLNPEVELIVSVGEYDALVP